MAGHLPYPALLAGTLVVEILVVALIWSVVRGQRDDPGTAQVLAACGAVNLCTHPLAYLGRVQLGLPFIAVEIAVVLFEGLGYRLALDLRLGLAALLAIAANLSTIALSYV